MTSFLPLLRSPMSIPPHLSLRKDYGISWSRLDCIINSGARKKIARVNIKIFHLLGKLASNRSIV